MVGSRGHGGSDGIGWGGVTWPQGLCWGCDGGCYGGFLWGRIWGSPPPSHPTSLFRPHRIQQRWRRCQTCHQTAALLPRRVSVGRYGAAMGCCGALWEVMGRCGVLWGAMGWEYGVLYGIGGGAMGRSGPWGVGLGVGQAMGLGVAIGLPHGPMGKSSLWGRAPYGAALWGRASYGAELPMGQSSLWGCTMGKSSLWG